MPRYLYSVVRSDNNQMMQTKFRIVSMLLLLFTAFTAGLFGQEGQQIVTPDTFFAKLSERYKGINDYTSDIVITVGKDVMKGKLYYKKPKFFRIDFSVPEDQVFCSNGDQLTVYLPQYRVSLVQTLRKDFARPDINSREGLLLLNNNYHKSFLKDPTPVPLDDGSTEMVTKLKLTWKSTQEGFRQIDLSIGENGLIRRIIGVTTANKLVQMDYMNIKTNQNIPDGRFLYNPPPSASQMSDFLGFNQEN